MTIFEWNKIYDDEKKLSALRRGEVTDEAVLKKVALTDTSELVRQAAIGQITDEAVLFGIAKDDKSESVRKIAVEKITDENNLREISELEENGYILYLISRKINVDETVWIKIAKNWSVGHALEHITNEAALIEIAMAVEEYSTHKNVVKKIANERALEKIINHWEAKGIKCFSDEEIHEWVSKSSHSHGWDYDYQRCKKCRKQTGGNWIDNR